MTRIADVRLSPWSKLGLALLLVALGDLVVHGRWTGAASGLLAAAAALGVAATHPRAERTRLGAGALAAAAALALTMVERPSPLGWLLLWTALLTASLASRAARVDNALQLALRMATAAAQAVPAPLRDLQLLRKARLRAGGREAVTVWRLVSLLALPLAGGAIFAALFAAANPIISQAFARLRLPELDLPRLALWGFLGIGFWLLLRPRGRPRVLRRLQSALVPARVREAPAASVVLSLAVFNALFAVQNGLDLAYLWGGAQLPPGTTYAEYAHRGAYPLILTALLAGAFVLVFLRPGSQVARRKLARTLVAAWVAQNLLLVTSTALRTLDYVEAYSLTRLRIAAFLWMALVALGLALIAWRLLRDKSSSWLINTNAAAAGLVLAACTVADLGAVVAAWNVRHARELGSRGAALDLCYLRHLGPAALVPLSELTLRPLPPELRTRVVNVRNAAMADLVERQSAWRSWTWRGERRLARARRLAGAPAPTVAPIRCDGAAVQPLTPAPQHGS